MEDALDLPQAAEELLSGRVSMETAEERIRQWAGRYALPPRPGEDPWGVLDRREQLAAALKSLVTRILEDEQPLRVCDLGHLAATAGRLLGPEIELLALVPVAVRLGEIQRPKLAWVFQERAAELAPAAGGDWPLLVSCLAANGLKELGRLEDAVEKATAAIEAASAGGRVECELFATEVRAFARSRLGRHGEALGDAARAVELSPQVKRPAAQPIVLLDIPSAGDVHFCRGLVARTAGAYETALAAWEQARGLFFVEGNPRAAAFALSEIGMLWEMLGDGERGGEILLRAAAEAEGLGMSSASRRWAKRFDGASIGDDRPSDLLARAQSLSTAVPPQHAAARRFYLECIRAVRGLGPDRIEVLARLGLAASYGFEGRMDESLAATRAAVRTARRLGDAGLEVLALSNLGRNLAALGRNGEAWETLQAAVAVGQQLRSDAATTELRQSIAAAMARAYETLAVLSATDWVRPDGSLGRRRSGADLHAVGERLRAANLTGWLSLGQAVEDAGSGELSNGFLALRAAEIEVERSALARGSLARVLERRALRFRELQSIAAAAGQALPEAPSPIDPPHLARSLGPRTAIVDLLSLHEGVTVTVTGGEGEPKCELVRWPRPDRLAFLARWRRRLQARLVEHGLRGVGLRGWRLGEGLTEAAEGGTTESLAGLLSELDERLLAPIASLLPEPGGIGRILLAPHRELLVLPFWRLERHVREVPVSIVPGLGAASWLQARPRRRDAGDWLSIGDATGELRFARRELEGLVGFRPVLPRLEEIVAEAATASLLHFAGHGRFDEVDPYLSGLVMTRRGLDGIPGDASPDPRFELLSVRGIFSRLRLPRCYLVVLSACCTGLPRDHPASEFTGLPAAFLVAGARNVVASLWAAHDAATALMMAEFYAALPTSGWRPSEALRRARAHVASLPRREAVERLGSETVVPECDPPFAGPEFTLCFQHYGVD